MRRIVTGSLLLLLVGCSPYFFLSTPKKKALKKQYASHTNILKAIAKEIVLTQNDTVCDIAAGFGFSVSVLADYLPASTIYFEEDIDKNCSAKSFKNAFNFYDSKANIDNFRFNIGTKESIPFSSKSFNNIILFISIHEFEYKEKMLNEVNRIMRDTGKLYLLETVYKDSVVKDENCGFAYLSEKELYHLIDQANFRIIKDADSVITCKESKNENSYAKFLTCIKK